MADTTDSELTELQIIPTSTSNLKSFVFHDYDTEDSAEQSFDSDQQLIIDNSAACDADSIQEEPKKRKGGWPKGKRRKKDILGSKAPKAPTTGYVLYLNERRQWYKTTHPDLDFASVTKLLGREWSNLEIGEKQKYLVKADEDKRRYREELLAYHNEKLDGVTENNKVDAESSLSSDKNNNEEFEELYCRICDQFFVTLHNKSEHMYGRQHLQMLTEKRQSKSNIELNGVSNSLAVEKSIQPNFNVSSSHCSRATNINQAILDFIQLTFDRNEEIRNLSYQLKHNRWKNETLKEDAQTFQVQLDFFFFKYLNYFFKK
ncbi:hypothetical protein CHUAL_008107 [Chamberlinius hualienensis]